MCAFMGGFVPSEATFADKGHPEISLSVLTYRTTRLLRFAKALSGMWKMRLRAKVRACRLAWCLREPTGTSVRSLSSSQRWRSCWRPSKLSSGTVLMWFASRRLQNTRTGECRSTPETHPWRHVHLHFNRTDVQTHVDYVLSIFIMTQCVFVLNNKLPHQLALWFLLKPGGSAQGGWLFKHQHPQHAVCWGTGMWSFLHRFINKGI